MIRMLALATALALAATPALAHTESHNAHHGGQVVVAGHDHLELVAKDGELTLYVRGEDDKPEAVKGAKATATVLVGGKQTIVTLEPQEGNILKGKGSFTVAKGMKVVVSLTLPDHKPVTARFSPAD
jgi:hypothetical protein